MAKGSEHVQVSIRPVAEEDRYFILALNKAEVDVLSPMDEKKLEHFCRIADAFWVAEVEGKQAAFIIALREGADYDSENYAFFARQYPKFLYIDRVVVDESFKRSGIGKALYKAMKDRAIEHGVPTITAEVDLEPVYNDASLRFHAGQGFVQVGTQRVRDASIKVALLAWDAGSAIKK